MSTVAPVSAPDRVSPALPIITTIIWLVVGVALVIPAMFSAMLFDSGESFAAWLAFAGFWAGIVVCFLDIPALWIAWGLTRSRRGGARILRGVLYLVPLVPLAVAGIGLALFPR